MTEPQQMTLPGLTPQWTLGDRLRKARETAGLNQTQLADEIDIARNSVGRYENGDYDVPRPVIIAWALRTGVDLQWLLGDHQGRRRGGYTDVPRSDPQRPHCGTQGGYTPVRNEVTALAKPIVTDEELAARLANGIRVSSVLGSGQVVNS